MRTSDILEAEDAIKIVREAEEDVKAGRVRDYDEFIEKLKESEERALACGD